MICSCGPLISKVLPQSSCRAAYGALTAKFHLGTGVGINDEEITSRCFSNKIIGRRFDASVGHLMINCCCHP